MHHHIKCLIHQVLIPIEQIVHVNILGVKVPIIKIYLHNLIRGTKSHTKLYQDWENLINLFNPSNMDMIQENLNITSSHKTILDYGQLG
jgi:hypothetical protein